VTGDDGRIHAVITIGRIMTAYNRGDSTATVADLMRTDVTKVYDNDTLRHVANIFAEFGVTRAPVVDRAAPDRLLGVVSFDDLLLARKHDLSEEHVRERHLLVRRPPSET